MADNLTDAPQLLANLTNSTGGSGGACWACYVGWTWEWICGNVVVAALLVSLVTIYMRRRGFDQPVRSDGVAPECGEAVTRAMCGFQGGLAHGLWCLGSVLLVTLLASNHTVKTTIVAAVAHGLSFALFALRAPAPEPRLARARDTKKRVPHTRV